MKYVLQAKGYADEDLDFIINMYLGGELRGHKSHGLASFPGFAKEDFSKLEKPEVIKETHAFFFLDAKNSSGNVIGRRLADEAVARAKKEAIGFSLVKNMNTWMRPGAIAEYIADQGFVAIVSNNNGGEPAVAPPGGYEPVTGTNPIAYGIPTDEDSLVVDMATSKRSKGEIRLANRLGTDLPADSFYDNQGNITLDPKEAFSILPFGEYKGFALTLLVEVLCGSLVGAPMRPGANPETTFGAVVPERTAFILVIDPAQTTDLHAFKQANSEFLEKIKATRPRKGEKIRIPGEQATSEKSAKLAQDIIEIPDELWEEIRSL
jgi:L-2-hydroxycarboxylate dehydrogenase (NAD+)